MLPGIGGLELIVIIVLLIIFVNPNDLPVILKTMGKAIRRIKKLVQEFKVTINDIADESSADDIKNTIDKAKQVNLTEELTNSINDKIKKNINNESDEDNK
jgi:sec-independent protein translocase protein TatB